MLVWYMCVLAVPPFKQESHADRDGYTCTCVYLLAPPTIDMTHHAQQAAHLKRNVQKKRVRDTETGTRRGRHW
jgi:hypothetical protein